MNYGPPIWLAITLPDAESAPNAEHHYVVQSEQHRPALIAAIEGVLELPLRPRGRIPYMDPEKATLARALLLAGNRPWHVRKRTGLSYDGVQTVLNQLKRERQAK